MSILVIAEHDNTNLKGATLNTLAAAAARVFRVAPLRLVLSCSAITNILILSPSLHFLIYLLTHQHFLQ